jgi:UDP-glucose 4-epimerase
MLSLKILDERFINKHVILTGHQSIRFRDLLNMISEIMSYDVKIHFTGETHNGHYELTPYSYAPKRGLKLTSNVFIDLGQGLLECLHEIDAKSAGKYKTD